VETPPYSKNKVARYYLAATTGADVELPVNPELGAPEHHEFRWVTFAAAAPLAVERIQGVLRWAEAQLG